MSFSVTLTERGVRVKKSDIVEKISCFYTESPKQCFATYPDVRYKTQV